jgi:hypothetical protein
VECSPAPGWNRCGITAAHIDLFSNARWSGDALGLALADLIVARLLPAGAAFTIAVDDTLSLSQ